MLHARIVHQIIVEGTDGAGLRIGCIFGVYDVAVPKRIVGYEHTPMAQARQHEFVVFNVLPLVGIYEGEVELPGNVVQEFEDIAHYHVDARRIGRTLQPRAGEIFLLVVDFKRI